MPSAFLPSGFDARRPVALIAGRGQYPQLTAAAIRRAGVPLRGVGMPGHFLVRDMVDQDLFIDPFAGGRTMPAAACRKNSFESL